MKTIFTLVVLVVFNTLSLKAQINENFESHSSTTTLTNNCWQFVWVGISRQSVVNGANSLEIIPTTSQSNNTQSNISQIATPYINLANGTAISFNYKMGSRLSNNATRTMVVKLQDINGATETIGTVNLTSASNTTLFSFNYTSTSQTVRKLVLDITGNGDGNSYLYLDDLAISSTFNYFFPYACASHPASIILPIKLLSFNAGLVNNKASLQWSVADNETGNYFEVQKSNDGKTFTTIGVVLVSEKNGTENYSFTDTKEIGAEAYYRLQIVNKNASVSQSKTILLKGQAINAASSLAILQNPVESALVLSYTSTVAGKATVNIYSTVGVKMHTMVVNCQSGSNAVSVNLDGKFNSGAYLLEVVNGTDRTVSRFIKR
jgi:hypothetical protein